MSTPVKTGVGAKLLLVVGGIAFALGLGEFAVFPLLLPHTPLRLQIFLPDGVRVLAQSSKDARLPESYVALAGDSYAQGRGDWLLGQNPNGNGPFHSAHILHDRTGRDVSMGAVHATLDRLERKGYLSSLFGEPTPERGGKARRFFCLEAGGREAFAEAADAVRAMLSDLGALGDNL